MIQWLIIEVRESLECVVSECILSMTVFGHIVRPKIVYYVLSETLLGNKVAQNTTSIPIIRKIGRNSILKEIKWEKLAVWLQKKY